jgi:hypothetical protein
MSAELPRYNDSNHTLTLAMRDHRISQNQFKRNMTQLVVAILECHNCHELFEAATNDASYCGAPCKDATRHRTETVWGKVSKENKYTMTNVRPFIVMSGLHGNGDGND